MICTFAFEWIKFNLAGGKNDSDFAEGFKDRFDVLVLRILAP